MVIAGLVLAATALAAEPARRVRVADLISDSASYFDQRLVVTGVVHIGAWGPDLCELPSEADVDGPRCTDLASVNLPFRDYDYRYLGAVVEVVGYFTHRCYKKKQAEPDGTVEEFVCVDRGRSGWFYGESVRVVGAVGDCPDEICSRKTLDKFSEVDLSSPTAAGIDVFARRVVDASRSGRVERMLDLLVPSYRTEIGWYLRRGGASARDWVQGGLASAPASVTQPGVGYRLIQIDESASYPYGGPKKPYEQLCFCTTADCSRSWKYAGRTPTALRTLPIRCFDVWRGPEGWRLLY